MEGVRGMGEGQGMPFSPICTCVFSPLSYTFPHLDLCAVQQPFYNVTHIVPSQNSKWAQRGWGLLHILLILDIGRHSGNKEMITNTRKYSSHAVELSY